MSLSRRFTLVAFSLLVTGALFSSLAFGTCLSPRLTGVNVAGAEFNSKALPGTIFKDYTYPNESELAFIAAQGANVIRLPFRWERIQHTAYGELDDDELAALKNTVSQAASLGLCVILDIHNYAKYFRVTMGTDNVEPRMFVDLWRRLAKEFADPRQTIFGLMNEPAHISITGWAALAQRTVRELRKADSQNYILVAGGRWSGVHDWFKPQSDGASNAKAMAALDDPINRLYIEAHQYADLFYSGTQLLCKDVDTFAPMFEKFTQWGKENNVKLLLGEFGMAATPHCLNVLDHFLQWMANDQWLGWTYWAAGGWWGNYAFALNTDSENPSRQWAVLKPHFSLNQKPVSPAKIKGVEVRDAD